MKRLVLFDIDETIVASYGVGRRSLTKALCQATGQAIDSSQIALSGKTDPQICREILLANKLSLEGLEGGLERIYEFYLPTLAREIALSGDYQLHAGVRELVEHLNVLPQFHLALLTGNIEAGARLKLEPFSLNHFFLTGAFGSDNPDRLLLPAIAWERSQKLFQCHFEPAEVVVIGDSVNDVRCAKHFGARTIAVATGKTSVSDLVSQNPEFLFDSLCDTAAIVEAIVG